MAKFEIGEVVLMVNSEGYPELNGQEGTVIGYACISDTGSLCDYEVKDHSGLEWACLEYHLRKKKPPESKDIQETRQANPIKFDDVMREANREVVTDE